MKKAVLFLSLLLLAAPPALATERSEIGIVTSNNPAQKCNMRSDVNIGINFSDHEFAGSKDPAAIKGMMDAKIEDVKAVAAASGITTVELQNFNYSVNVTNPHAARSSCPGGAADTSGMTYQVYGNAGFKVQPEDKAAGFMSALVKKGYTANLNVNSYRQCQ